MAAAPDGSDVGPRGDLVARDAGLLGHVEDVELVVPDTPALGREQLGRAGVHAAVELHGVGVDDLSPSRSARSRARSDLPVAVGPTTATIGSASEVSR